MNYAKRQFARGMIWLLIAALLLCCAASAWTKLDQRLQAGHVSYREPNGALSMADIRTLQKNMAGKYGRVAGWGQSLAEWIETIEMGSGQTVDVIWAMGDTPLIWPLSMARGQLPAELDFIGCAIDEKTALTLFGSLDVVGKEVEISGKRMTVRGVFELPQGIEAFGIDPGRGMAICPAALSGEDVSMTALDFDIWPSDGKTAVEQAEALMREISMAPQGTFNDHADEVGLLTWMTGLPGWVLAGVALFEILTFFFLGARLAIKRFQEVRIDHLLGGADLLNVCLKACLLAALTCGAVWGIVALAWHQGAIPATFLPTSWSDFGFWSKLFVRLGEEAAQANFEIALRPDLALARLEGLTGLLTVASVFCLLFATRAIRQGREYASPWQIAVCFPIAAAAAPVCMGLVKALGWPAATLQGGLILPLITYCGLVLPRTAFILERWIGAGTNLKGVMHRSAQ